MIPEEGHEADGEHDGHEEHEQNVELAGSLYVGLGGGVRQRSDVRNHLYEKLSDK